VDLLQSGRAMALQVNTSAKVLRFPGSGLSSEIRLMQEILVYSIAVILAIAAGCYALKQTFERVTIWQSEKGLRYHRGRFDQLLDPGIYWVLKPTTRVVRVEMLPQYAAVIGQEVLSSDSIGLKISVVAKFRVDDPCRAINEVQDYRESIHSVIQIALREIIGSAPIDELLRNRQSFDIMLMEKCEKEVEELGLKLLSANLRDIMFPGELKKVFAQVVKAQKEGQAALERARGETAALRSLANAAKMMENNPTLLQLRTLQALGESSGNTVVLELSGNEAWIRPRKGNQGLGKAGKADSEAE
jgi:regulator of protease activity HflC (stomatin/prohibitin superfamily)